MGQRFDVVEASVAELCDALEAGRVTSVALVVDYLERIARFDRCGPLLNSVPVLNDAVFAEAAASDERRSHGRAYGRLDGIPYTVKDSFAVEGMSLAAGSPAFEDLVANADAFTVERLRAAGAVVLGRTTMPPMANGGMQRGLYGRAESPYNGDFLTAAFASGSSNGSGTATAASFCAFGLGEETWSSGRAPASNNGLVAYTPSRGVISVRGNWPLVPTMDVVVPHTRTIADLLEVLEVLVADDADSTGDFWRTQPWVELPKASHVRPASYRELPTRGALRGVRLGVPRMYINADDGADEPIETRDSVFELWRQAREDLVARGAEVVDVDFPVVSNYERDRPDARSMVDRGLVPVEFEHYEMWDLCMLWWDAFLKQYAAAGPSALTEVDGPMIFPVATGALTDRYGEPELDLADYVERARSGLLALDEIPAIADGVRGLERTRQVDFEEWLVSTGIDGVVFPAVADVGPVDADVEPASARLAWRNGTWVANGNLVPRHLGIPTVTVPMGLMSDISMPVGLTFAGPAYSDSALLAWAADFESVRPRRVVPPRTPRSGGSVRPADPGDVEPRRTGHLSVRLEGFAARTDDPDVLSVRLNLHTDHDVDLVDVHVSLNGIPLAVSDDGSGRYSAAGEVAEVDHQRAFSEWSAPYGSLAVCYVRDATGSDAGAFTVVAPLPASDT